jgi:hypothetical protein
MSRQPITGRREGRSERERLELLRAALDRKAKRRRAPSASGRRFGRVDT